MINKDVSNVIRMQKRYYQTGQMKSITKKISALRKLKQILLQNKQEISAALINDLGYGECDLYEFEVDMAIEEINGIIKNLMQSKKIQKIKELLKKHIFKHMSGEPYGLLFLICSFKDSIFQSLQLLAYAIAAGNTVILKLSNRTIITNNIFYRIINQQFSDKLLYVITKEEQKETERIIRNCDYVFFYGELDESKEINYLVKNYYKKMTRKYVGKNPVIVDETANIRITAKKIIQAKFKNTNKSLKEIDYVYCADSVKNQLFVFLQKESKKVLSDQFLIKALPIYTYQNINDVIVKLNILPQPMAIYFFSESLENISEFKKRFSKDLLLVNHVNIERADIQKNFLEKNARIKLTRDYYKNSKICWRNPFVIFKKNLSVFQKWN